MVENVKISWFLERKFQLCLFFCQHFQHSARLLTKRDTRRWLGQFCWVEKVRNQQKSALLRWAGGTNNRDQTCAYFLAFLFWFWLFFVQNDNTESSHSSILRNPEANANKIQSSWTISLKMATIFLKVATFKTNNKFKNIP